MAIKKACALPTLDCVLVDVLGGEHLLRLARLVEFGPLPYKLPESWNTLASSSPMPHFWDSASRSSSHRFELTALSLEVVQTFLFPSSYGDDVQSCDVNAP